MVFHFPPISGGGVVVIVDIVNKLVELGNDVTVITPNLDWNGERYNPKINSKIKVIRTETPSKSKIKVAASRCQSNMKKKAIEIGKQEKFDFIFTIFHPFHLVPKAAVESAKELQIPSVLKVDDAIYEKASGIKSVQRRIEKMINSKTLRNASNVLVSNNDTKKVIINEYNVSPEKISIIGNKIDVVRIFEAMRKAKIISDKRGEMKKYENIFTDENFVDKYYAESRRLERDQSSSNSKEIIDFIKILCETSIRNKNPEIEQIIKHLEKLQK